MPAKASCGFWIAVLSVCSLGVAGAYAAQADFPYPATVEAEGINIRADATIGAGIICKLEQGQELMVVAEAYDWCKVVLPAYAPAFIKKDFVLILDNQTVKVTARSVNIRVGPSESTPIIGRAGQNQVLRLVSRNRGWLRVLPTSDCTGWVHTKFLRPAATLAPAASENSSIDTSPAQPLEIVAALPILDFSTLVQEIASGPDIDSSQGSILVEGIVRSYGKVFGRVASHKLVTKDNKTYLLKGDYKEFKRAVYRKVRVLGTIVADSRQSYPVIAVTNLEFSD